MALVDLSREQVMARRIKGILRETMGDNYELQLTKRYVLNKDDVLIEHIKKLEDMLGVKILDSNIKPFDRGV